MKSFATFVISILSFCTLSSGQQIKLLNSFRGGNYNNQLPSNYPYALYVTAHSDASEVLQQVFVKTSDNSILSLYALKNRKQTPNSGLLEPFVVNTTAYLSTALGDDVLATLRGFIYITTAKQLSDSSFRVYEVDQSQKISIDALFLPNSTLVFLNTNGQTSPLQSSTFSAWSQRAGSSVSLYRGYPYDAPELSNSQIFSNPVQATSKQTLFIPNVEKFSLSLGIFYLKTYQDVSFVVEPSYFNIDGTATSAYSTTGFYMKAINQLSKDVTVVCLRDANYNGTTGGNIVGMLPSQGDVTLQENDGPQSSSLTVTPTNQILGWTTSHIGQNVTISSVGTDGGEFFVQYFIYQDQRISGVESTTVSVQTTTKSSAVLSNLLSLTIVVFLSCF